MVSHKCCYPRSLIASGLVGIHILGGHLDICLCLSVLPGFLDNHPVAKKVVNGVGRDKACDYFTGLVSGSFFTLTFAQFTTSRVCRRSGTRRVRSNVNTHNTPVRSVIPSVLAILRVRTATPLPRQKIPPTVSASPPTVSVMGFVGSSRTDVAPKNPAGRRGANIPLVPLERPFVASPTTRRVMIVLISTKTLRAVSDSVLGLWTAILRTEL